MTTSASLALAHAHAPTGRPRPDPARVLTLSSTLALNLLVFGLLLIPVSLPPPAVDPPTRRDLQARILPKPPEVVEVVTLPRPTPSAPTPERRSVATPRPEPVSPPAVVADTGTTPAIDANADSREVGPPDLGLPPQGGPAPMQLAYRDAPAPAYPRAALQRRLAGTVLLQVLVDVDGRPLEVTVSRSSGHRELDEAARLQVLKRWRFQPANRDGLPVQAIGLVPVEFALRG